MEQQSTVLWTIPPAPTDYVDRPASPAPWGAVHLTASRHQKWRPGSGKSCGLLERSRLFRLSSEWNLQSDAQGQITKFTLTVSKEGDALKGKVVSEAYGSQDLKDLKFENGSLTFTRNLEIGGQAAAMAFKGKIEGDKLTGNYSLEGFDIPVTGSRKTTSPTPADSTNK